MQSLELLDNQQVRELLQYVFDYPVMEITKIDLQKRKRVKNSVPFCERCCAVRANNEQCTRRKKSGEKFCGTHIKGTPHGEINENMESKEPETVKIQIWAEEISGIIHHLDNKGNVKDVKGYHKAIYAAENADTIAQHFYEQGKADAIKDVAAKSKNISNEARATAPSDVFVGGLKVKSISGLDSSKLKI